MLKNIFIGWMFALLVVAGAAQAQEKTIRPIQPVPEIGGQTIIIPKYIGTIGGDITDDVGIDDVVYRLASDVKFYSATAHIISKTYFKRGERIGYAVNSVDEIVSIWKLNQRPLKK